ncbi:MAG: tetratricopeptide repeat protein, partial [Burkholderiales bacterium]|nr:tetratricopeptide repeat protein [Burkholderiales bacterium]
TLQDLGRTGEALACFEQALARQPGAPILQYNRGNALLGLGRFAEAVDSYDVVLRQLPDHADAWNNRGNALMETGHFDEALHSFDRALALRPDFADARINRGNALLELDRVEEAEAEFASAVAADRSDAAARNGLGMARQRSNDFTAAESDFSRALELDPGFDEARLNLALLRLFRHDFAGAWGDYESRLQVPEYRPRMRRQPHSVDLFRTLPRWDGPGTAVAGTVAVWAEQGIGDQILFSTLLPELLRREQHFLIEVDSRLINAYRRSFPAAAFVGLADPPVPELTGAAAAIFAGSLPRWFRRDAASFTRQPRGLLQALPGHVADLGDRLGAGFRVALSWRSGRSGWRGRDKSLALDAFRPLFGVAGVNWVDVQYGDTVGERRDLEQRQGIRIRHFDDIDYREDLEKVLALLECCDLLITTSNASAHLAAALGKPVWLLYPGERAPFHYWSHDGDHRCLWYPSVEIVSAPQLDDWPKLITHAAARLQALVAERN